MNYMQPFDAQQLLYALLGGLWTILNGPIGLALLDVIMLRLLLWYVLRVKRDFDRFTRMR